MRMKPKQLVYWLLVLTAFIILWDKVEQIRKGHFYTESIRPTAIPKEVKNIISNSHKVQVVGEKVILAYTNFYGKAFNISTVGRTRFDRGIAPDPLKVCKYRCRWSTDHNELPSADAVIFHMYNNKETYRDFVINKLPRRSNLDQKWILMAREPSAFYYPDQLKLLDDKFNLTVTYQRDSDVQIPYGSYWILPSKSLAYKSKMKMDYLSGKKRKVAWVASNCKTSSRREEFVNQLEKYIPIDTYGKCGNLTADSESANNFREMIAQDYLFYIAFENSDCDDYISEKFWNSLHVGLIPIVRGLRPNYKKLAPPNSYIQVESFVSPKQLATHLEQISRNTTLFHQYHQWRRLYDANYKFFTTNSNWMCDLCKEVHTSPRKTVSIYEHFSEDSRCMPYLDHNGRDRNGEHMEDLTY